MFEMPPRLLKRRGRFLRLIKRIRKARDTVSEKVVAEENGLREMSKLLFSLEKAESAFGGSDRGDKERAQITREIHRVQGEIKELRRKTGEGRIEAIGLQQESNKLLKRARRLRAAFPRGFWRRFLAGPKANRRLHRMQKRKK
jgi:hypothetical protein